MLNPMSTTLKNHPQPLINVTDYPDPNVTSRKKAKKLSKHLFFRYLFVSLRQNSDKPKS